MEFSIEEFKEAKDELIRLSQNSEERSLYELREKPNKDRTSALAKSKREGIEEGRKEGKKRFFNFFKKDYRIFQ